MLFFTFGFWNCFERTDVYYLKCFLRKSLSINRIKDRPWSCWNILWQSINLGNIMKKKKLLSLLVVFFIPTKGTQNQQQWNSGKTLEPDKTILLNTESRLKTSYPATKDFIISSKSSQCIFLNLIKLGQTEKSWKEVGN